MPHIDINQDDVFNYSSNIRNNTSMMEAKSLQPVDDESTIAGNVECQEVFAKSQDMLAKFIETVQIEADKIKQLGSAFSNADNELANMVRSLSSK